MRSRLAHLCLAGWASLPGLCLCQELEPPDPQKMWALVVGISRYAHAEPLEFAASDAMAVRDFLASPRGGGVPENHVFTLLEDQATRKSLEIELEAMQGRLKAGDTVYVFLAGHGYLTSRGIGYFVPSDGDMRVPASTSISFAALKELIELGLGNAGRRVLMTDLCHAGRIGPENAELTQKIQNLINAELLKVAQGAPGSYLNLLSSHPLEPSWESDKLKSGIFSYTLLEALNGKAAPPGSSVVRAGELVAYLRTEVPKSTGGRQTPMVNEDFDSRLPLAFLDRPATPPASSTASRRPAASNLIILNADRAPYIRVQWVDPQTQAVAVRLIPSPANRFQIDSLTPGELELLFFDSGNRTRRVVVSLKAGTNTLDLADGRGERRSYRAQGQIQRVSYTTVSAPIAVRQEPAGNAAAEAALLMKLDAGTQVFVDGDFYGASPGAERYFLLSSLSPGRHNLSLVPSPEREQRFRIKLFSGRQVFDAQSGELRAVVAVQPPPDFLPLPPSLPAAQEDVYRKFAQALWEEKLVEPEGRCAFDYFEQLRAAAPAQLAEPLRNRLVIAMGDRAQRIVLKYLRGGDIRWSAAAFEEGAALVRRVQTLHRATDALRSQESFFRGRSLIERGQYSEAVRELQQSIRLDATAGHAMNALGLALWKQNLLDQAMAPLEQAVSLYSAWTYPRNTLGLILLEQRRYQEAAQHFRTSIELNNEDSMAFHCLGQLELLLGRLDDAEGRVREALDVNPGNAYAYETLGKLYQRRQRYDEAERMLRLAIRLEPDEISFQLSLAELLQRAGRSGAARSIFGELLQRNPANPPVLFAYAVFLDAQKETGEAERTFRRAVEAAANDPNGYVRFGLFLQQQGRPDEAIRQFRAALRLAPANPYAHHNLAVTYLSQKKLPEAEKELAEAVNADARYPAPRLLLGDLRSVQKRYVDALSAYQAALSLSIDVHQQEDIREKIRQAQGGAIAERIEEARRKRDRKEYPAAWAILAEALKTAPDHRELRDSILGIQAEYPAAADLAALPPSRLTETLGTALWQELLRAERLWHEGQKARAAEAVLSAVQSMKPAERPLVLSVYFNLGNERFSIHNRISQWALRLVEQKDYAAALRLLDEAVRQNIFGVVPSFSPLTVDSLMVPPDNPAPSRFADFEVAHHPDRRAHEAYAAAHAGLGELEAVRKYLLALEATKPDLAARLAAARAFRQESNWGGAILVLKESLIPELLASSQDLASDVLVLLADSQCRADDCAAGRATLEGGLKLFPENRTIRDALRKLTSPRRSSP